MINIIQGDATHPQTEGRNIIVHGCNDVGGWGAGFVLAVDKISPLPRIRYRAWARNKTTYCLTRKEDIPFILGQVQFVPVQPKLAVCNLISQRGYGGKDKDGEWVPAARYDAIEIGLIYIKHHILNLIPEANLHFTMIVAGLGGLDFARVYNSIDYMFSNTDTNVTIYGFTQSY